MTDNVPGLRDIHLPPAPSWWPPAPGWWVLAALLLIALVWIIHRLLRKRARRNRMDAAMRDYDLALSYAPEAPAQLAAVSQALRRAAKARDPNAALLEGDAWLRFLDGDNPAKPFSVGAGRLLLDGGFRRTIDEDIAATLTLARARFAQLLERDDA